MKTLKLTDEQIDIIKHALGIAERNFIDIHTKIVKETISVRGLEDKVEQETGAKYYHKKACLFADLNNAIKNGCLEIKKRKKKRI
jgi:hypothetical protein